MATPRTYTVVMIPAEVSDAGRVLSCVITQFVTVPKKRLMASSLSDLESKLREMALEFGQSCALSIDVPRGDRKPPGFDAFKSKLQGIKIAA